MTGWIRPTVTTLNVAASLAYGAGTGGAGPAQAAGSAFQDACERGKAWVCPRTVSGFQRPLHEGCRGAFRRALEFLTARWRLMTRTLVLGQIV